MISKEAIFPIGIGTWGYGGFLEKDPEKDERKAVDAVVYMFQRGCNFLEVGLWGAERHSAHIVSKAIEISGIAREKLFITLTVSSQVEAEIHEARELFVTDHFDSIQFQFEEVARVGEYATIDQMKQLISDKKARYISITKHPLRFLERLVQELDDALFAQEICHNFEIRANEEAGHILYANKNNILNVIFQPLRRNRTARRNWPLLIELSNKYGKTLNQIILNWLVNTQNFLPITKSENIVHIDEHFDALTFVMEDSDLQRIDSFKPPRYVSRPIDWELTGSGIRIDQLSNAFDQEFERQNLKVKNS